MPEPGFPRKTSSLRPRVAEPFCRLSPSSGALGLSESQAKQVLGGIDRTTDVGRRNYAILHLLDTYVSFDYDEER